MSAEIVGRKLDIANGELLRCCVPLETRCRETVTKTYWDGVLVEAWPIGRSSTCEEVSTDRTSMYRPPKQYSSHVLSCRHCQDRGTRSLRSCEADLG